MSLPDYEEKKIIIIQKKLNQNILMMKKYSSENSYDLNQQIFEAIKGKEKKKVYKLITEELKLKSSVSNEEVIRIIKNEYILFVISITEKMIEERLIEAEKCFTLLNAAIIQIQASKGKEEDVRIVLAMIFEYIKYMEVENNKSYHYLIILVKEYIRNNLNNKIGIALMAKEIGTNSSYLSRLFHQKEGITIQQYICKQRVKQAKSMLCSSNYTNEEISKNLGFSSLSYFGKILKDCTGMTPNQYRLKFRVNYEKENMQA